ncbi:Mitochondrial chaperone Frataxin [Linnemannia gamsii]|uniref:ferroxidase n=1 Tax=Linnemannia gamsii TaxID=64522 RepID=A0ABQ7K9E1_9FUNG|nr:Mitochondrial chaperone Frataxin [Linnemannia gamsii]
MSAAAQGTRISRALLARTRFARQSQPSVSTRTYTTASTLTAAASTSGRLARLPQTMIPRSSTPLCTSSSLRTYTTMTPSSPEPTYTVSDLSEDDYHTASDASMDRMVEYFEDLGDEYEIPGYDVEYQSGVMTLKLGDKGTYVVNKQPPNKQLWLSSPTSGPKRYDFDAEHKVWFYGRDHHSLKFLLDTEITKAIGIDIDVPLDAAK